MEPQAIQRNKTQENYVEFTEHRVFLSEALTEMYGHPEEKEEFVLEIESLTCDVLA